MKELSRKKDEFIENAKKNSENVYFCFLFDVIVEPYRSFC